mgnify:FL=1
MKTPTVTVGGTFDHFHLGHEALIAKAYVAGAFVYLGITTDEFVKTSLSKIDRYAYLIEPYKQRKQRVAHFLRDKSFLERTEIFQIADRFGTRLID